MAPHLEPVPNHWVTQKASEVTLLAGHLGPFTASKTEAEVSLLPHLHPPTSDLTFFPH